METPGHYFADQYIPGHCLCSSKNSPSLRYIYWQPYGIAAARHILGRRIFSSYAAPSIICMEADE